jgi:hypothetical protein
VKFSFVFFVFEYTCGTIDSCHCVGWTFCHHLEARIEHPFFLLGSYQRFGWIFSLHLQHRSCLHFLALGLTLTGLRPRLLSLSLRLVKTFRLDSSVTFTVIKDVSRILRRDSKVGSPTPTQGEEFVSMYVRKHVLRYGPTTCWAQSLRFLFVRTFKNPSVFDPWHPEVLTVKAGSKINSTSEHFNIYWLR